MGLVFQETSVQV